MDTYISEVSKRLSNNLRMLMVQDRVMKVTELSKKSGVSVAAISRMKNDYLGKSHYTLDTLAKLAKGLEVDVADLLKNDLFQSK